MPSTKKASFCYVAAVLEGQHGDRRACVGGRRGRCRLHSRSCGRRRGAALRVQPQQAAAEKQQQRQHRKLRAGDSLLAAVAVVPAEDYDDRQADREQRWSRSALTVAGQAKESLTKPSTCSSTHAPAAYASPHWTTLRRRSLAQMLSASRSAGVSVNRRPPWRRSVAAYPRVRAGNRSTVT